MLTVFMFAVILMMLVVLAGSTVWEFASDDTKEKMIELIEDSAYD